VNEPVPEVTFAGSVPEIYDRHLVPMIFDAYAADLTARLQRLDIDTLLEIAAGTGAVTRAMATGLPEAVTLVATDLSPAMVEHARMVGTARPVEWRVADVMELPFPDGGFDAVVCQFGAMFFPDRVHAYREIARVLRPGGTLLFNVWDRLEHNEFANVVAAAVSTLHPDDPPTFLERIPHGYFLEDEIRSDLSAAGFENDDITIDEVTSRSRAATSDEVATAYCHGTPLRNFLEAHGAAHLDLATATTRAAISNTFGDTDLDAKISAFVVTASKR
jgi:SAM-dependent methyltransferase